MLKAKCLTEWQHLFWMESNDNYIEEITFQIIIVRKTISIKEKKCNLVQSKFSSS